MTPETAWRRSSYCASNACVEVAHHGGQVLMRDSKQTDSPHLTFGGDGWAGFLETVRAGDLEQEAR